MVVVVFFRPQKVIRFVFVFFLSLESSCQSSDILPLLLPKLGEGALGGVPNGSDPVPKLIMELRCASCGVVGWVLLCGWIGNEGWSRLQRP